MRVSTTIFISIVTAALLAASLTVGAVEKAAINRNVTTAKVDLMTVAKELREYAKDLRNIESQMTSIAKTQAPGYLDSSNRAQFENKRSELKATAAATKELVSRIEGMAKKAERGTLTRADMENLGLYSEPVIRMTDRASADVAKRTINSTDLNRTIHEVESQQEAARNKRQQASTAFQNFDQKANQQFNLLSSVMKAMNEMRLGAVRNML
jgi:hypothetical protein